MERPWTKYWIEKFKVDAVYGAKRFKKLDVGYPSFDIDETIVDIVNLDDFIKIEDNRIPLFIGSQFGIKPDINKLSGFFNGEKEIAILNKSMLSGVVSGLGIFQIHDDDTVFKNNEVKFFTN